MSGLEALSLVCNILQLIEAAHKGVTLCKDIYSGGSPDEQLVDNAASLASLSADVQQSNNAVSARTTAQKDLSNIARKCNVAARALEEESKFIAGQHAKGNLFAALSVAAKANWRKNRLDRLERSLKSYQATLGSHLMLKTCKQTDALAVQQRQGFDKLDIKLQYFIDQLAAGTTNIEDLVNRTQVSVNEHMNQVSLQNEVAINKHTIADSNEAETSVKKHVDHVVTSGTACVTEKMDALTLKAATTKASEGQRTRLLRSLKFAGMNERRNQLDDAHDETFHWIFAEAQPSEPDESYHSYSSVSERYHDDSMYGSDGDPIDDDNVRISDANSHDGDDAPRGGEDPDQNYASGMFSDAQDSLADEYSQNSMQQSREELYRAWDSFSDWLKSEGRVYWISGKPGSGKSTLVKFLLDHWETKAALKLWHPDTLILGHFFWKPGATLQKTIKGLFLTLLHQVLHARATLVDRLLEDPTVVSKDADSDWSVKALEKALLSTLDRCPSNVCIFIDGLDEVGEEDGQPALLGTIQRILAIDKVKMCLASRPEPMLDARLRDHPQLRLQDLTYDDMHAYAVSTLADVWHNVTTSAGERNRFVWDVLRKAEGVFLWLHLALRSVTTGLEHGDSYDILLLRLDEISNELSALYSDMWMRVNGRTKAYLASASLYMNLVLDFDDEIITDFPGAHIHNTLTSLVMMAATTVDLQKAMFEKGEIPSAALVQEQCLRVIKEIQVRCAGLLVFNIVEKGPHLEASESELSDTSTGHTRLIDEKLDRIRAQNCV